MIAHRTLQNVCSTFHVSFYIYQHISIWGETISNAVPSLPTYFFADCPGTGSEDAGKADACAGCPNQAACATAPKGPDPDLAAISERLSGVKNIVMVLSGKGGVGKSTVSAQLAFALAARGLEVGLLDIDICGPSVPKMLGLEGEEIHQSNLGWSPVYVSENLGVMSIGFMLPNPDDAVIWRGPRKNGLIKQFLKDVDWGKLDYLIIDAPPGTSDEHISAAQFLKPCGNLAGAVVVTTPQQVAIIDVRKEINFCKKTNIPVLGVVENMAGLRQPLETMKLVDTLGNDVTAAVLKAIQSAGIGSTEGTHSDSSCSIIAETDVFWAPTGGAETMAKELSVPFLGRIPLDAALSRAAEEGRSLFDQPDGKSIGNGVNDSSSVISASVGPLQAVIDKLIAATSS